jgi:hypothetical protein
VLCIRHQPQHAAPPWPNLESDPVQTAKTNERKEHGDQKSSRRSHGPWNRHRSCIFHTCKACLSSARLYLSAGLRRRVLDWFQGAAHGSWCDESAKLERRGEQGAGTKTHDGWQTGRRAPELRPNLRRQSLARRRPGRQKRSGRRRCLCPCRLPGGHQSSLSEKCQDKKEGWVA